MNALKLNKNRNFEKEDKGTTLVVMNKNDKTQEGPVQTNDLNNTTNERYKIRFQTFSLQEHRIILNH